MLQEEKVFSKLCQEALWVVGTEVLTVAVTLIQAPVNKQVLRSLKECHLALNVFLGDSLSAWLLLLHSQAMRFTMVH